MGLSWGHRHGLDARPRMPEPEQVFLTWLVAQPEGADLLGAASRQVARLARYTGGHPGPRQLRRMFAQLVAELERADRDKVMS